jgi:uncharacterized protein YjiS (DUF1127 family)
VEARAKQLKPFSPRRDIVLKHDGRILATGFKGRSVSGLRGRVSDRPQRGKNGTMTSSTSALATGLTGAASTTTGSGAQAAAGFRRAVRLLRAARRGAVGAAVAWHELARQRRSLRELDDHLLRDIGLTREQVAMEAARPFWRR